MDHSSETFVGFVGAHGDAFELLEFAEEILDERAPFVHFEVDCERGYAARMLRDDDLAAPRVEVSDDGVRVERHVGNQSAEIQSLNQRGNANRVEPLPRQQDKPHKIAESIRQSEDFGGYSAL